MDKGPQSKKKRPVIGYNAVGFSLRASQLATQQDIEKEGHVEMQPGVLVRVFVASPGDVSEEREEACRVVADWNAAHSFHKRAIIEPVRVETHSQLAQGAHPQDLINGQLLDRCDFLVAILWSRLGTTTARDPSGTLQEIREFSEAKGPKRVLLFFSSKPMPNNVDIEELERVRTFQREMRDKGLYSEFNGIPDFARKLRQQIELLMNSLLESPEAQQISNRESSVRLLPASCTLIVEATLDNNGTIIVSTWMGGTDVQTNGRNMCVAGDSRSVAKWKAAVDQLSSAGLIEDRGNEKAVFGLTQRGYEAADELWRLVMLRVLLQQQRSEYDYVAADSIGSDAWESEVPTQFVQEKLDELAKARLIEIVPADGGIAAARITLQGRKLLRENTSVEFEEPDSPRDS